MDDLEFIIEFSFCYYTTVKGLIEWFNVALKFHGIRFFTSLTII